MIELSSYGLPANPKGLPLLAELKVKSGIPRVNFGSLGLGVAVGVMVEVAVASGVTLASGVAVSSDKVGNSVVGLTNAVEVWIAAIVPATRVAMTSPDGVAFEEGKLQEVNSMTVIIEIVSIFFMFPLVSEIIIALSVRLHKYLCCGCTGLFFLRNMLQV